MQQKFSYKRVLVFSWVIFLHNAPFLIGTLVLLLAMAIGNQFLATVLVYEVSLFVGVLVFVVGMMMSILLWMGLKFTMIKCVRRQNVQHEDLLTPAPYVLHYLIASFLYSCIVVVGLCLFVIPGIYWAVKYYFYRHFVVDQGLDPFQALYMSGNITKGLRWEIFLFILLVGGLNILGLLALGVGLLVSVPVTSLARARLYDRLLGFYEKEQKMRTREPGELFVG